jgi:hypothetical protein
MNQARPAATELSLSGAARAAARRAEDKTQITTGEHGKRRGGMHLLAEPEVLAVERDGDIDVVHDVANADGRHGSLPGRDPKLSQRG